MAADEAVLSRRRRNSKPALPRLVSAGDDTDNEGKSKAAKRSEWAVVNLLVSVDLEKARLAFLCLCLCACLFLLYACWFHFDAFHFRLSHVYASLGHAHAQHIVGERYLYGKGVERDEEKAMEWFRKAADAGHAHSSYNLAIGYLTGIRSDVRPGEAQRLIQHAHDNGVEEAADVLANACTNGMCE